MPFRISGPPQRSLIHSTSFHESCGSNCSAVQAPSEDRSVTLLAWPTILRKVRRLVPSIFMHQPGRVAICQRCLGVSFGGRRQAVAQVLVALAEDLQVERQHQRRALRGLGPVDQVQHELALAHDVELEPEGLGRDRRDILDRADAHGRQREGNAEGFGRLGCQHLAIGVLHAGQPGRRQRHRHRHLLADHGRFQRAVGHVDQHPLAQLHLGEVFLVGAIGALGPGAAVGVIEEELRYAALGKGLEVADFEDLRHGNGLHLKHRLERDAGGKPRTLFRTQLLG